jgi:hypothetical protein
MCERLKLLRKTSGWSALTFTVSAESALGNAIRQAKAWRMPALCDVPCRFPNSRHQAPDKGVFQCWVAA